MDNHGTIMHGTLNPRGFHVVVPLPLAKQILEIPHPAGRPHCIPVLQTLERREERSASIPKCLRARAADSVTIGEYLTFTVHRLCICVNRDRIDGESMNLAISSSYVLDIYLLILNLIQTLLGRGLRSTRTCQACSSTWDGVMIKD